MGSVRGYIGVKANCFDTPMLWLLNLMIDYPSKSPGF